jgi:hypothetical protein
MPRRSPRIRYIVAVTPKDKGVDLQAVRDDLDRPGGYRYVSIEDDGTIEVGVNARNVDEAEEAVRRDLGDQAPAFIVGHPPL